MTKEPTIIKEQKGFTTHNAKTGKLIKRDSGWREIKPTVQAEGSPVPPKIIKTAKEKALWKRLVESMPDGVFSKTDETLLASYVAIAVRHDEVIEAMRNEPLLITGSTGQKVANPLIRTQTELAGKLASIGARLGLDPVARASLAAPEGKSKKERSEEDDFYCVN